MAEVKTAKVKLDWSQLLGFDQANPASCSLSNDKFRDPRLAKLGPTEGFNEVAKFLGSPNALQRHLTVPFPGEGTRQVRGVSMGFRASRKFRAKTRYDSTRTGEGCSRPSLICGLVLIS